eukprot:3159375-Amphidinium_carterae.1
MVTSKRSAGKDKRARARARNSSSKMGICGHMRSRLGVQQSTRSRSANPRDLARRGSSDFYFGYGRDPYH